MILAFAARIASEPVGFCFADGGFFDLPPAGRIGSTGVGTFEARSVGYVFIGPVVGSFVGISDNFTWLNWFKNPDDAEGV
jgi:hypothetical protein